METPKVEIPKTVPVLEVKIPDLKSKPEKKDSKVQEEDASIFESEAPQTLQEALERYP